MKTNDHPLNIIRFDPNHSPKNFNELIDAYLELFNKKDNLKYLSLSNMPFDSKTIATFLKNAPMEEVEYYVALSPDDEIIGIAAFESYLIKGFHIIGIVVDDKYRFKGLGKALINKGIEIARKKGFKAIDISVFADNKSMLILLLKMDFKPIKIENHARYDGEDLINLKRYL
ncbi:MAG: GNAT family N-acetyltransferase [Methanobacterium sp.]|nr:GNAT family N-acetyltransferase [Methanobacterium sp.]